MPINIVKGPTLEKLCGVGVGKFRAAGFFFRYQIPCMNFFSFNVPCVWRVRLMEGKNFLIFR